MLKELKPQIEKFITTYGVIIPAVLAMLPFFLAFLMMLTFTYGNAKESAYIITQVGVLNVWLQGLAALIPLVTQVFLMSVLISLFFVWNKHKIIYAVFILLVLLMSAIVVPILVVALAIIGGIILAILKNKWSKELEEQKRLSKEKIAQIDTMSASELKVAHDETKAHITKLEQDIKHEISMMKHFALLFVIGLFIAAVIAYPSLPVSKITLENNDKISGVILKQDERNALLYQENGTEKLTTINADSIKLQKICTEDEPWALNRTALNLLANRTLIAKCE